MAKQVLKKRGKKEWYTVLAPDVFKNQVLGEILAYEPKDLVGRQVECSYSFLAEGSRDKSKTFSVRVTDVVEKNARTEPVKIIYSAGYVGRMARRNKTRALYVGNHKTADKKTITFKLYLLVEGGIVRGVNTKLLKETENFLNSKMSKIESGKVFELNYVENLGKELKTDLKPIFPISGIAFWKIEVA